MDVEDQFLFLLCNFCSSKGANCQQKNNLYMKTVIHEVLENFLKTLKVGGNEKQWGPGRNQMLGNSLGPWRSRFIYNLNTQLLNKSHISVSALSSKMNKQLLRLKGMQCKQWRMEVPCVNGDADKIRSTNYETVL
jgi:hypothetical protein